jgi:hypothetical protein
MYLLFLCLCLVFIVEVTNTCCFLLPRGLLGIKATGGIWSCGFLSTSSFLFITVGSSDWDM